MKISLLSLLLIAGVSCSKQKNDCSKFKTGTFKYEDPALSKLIVIRKDSLQLELNEDTQSKTVGVISWISDCQYKLTFTEVSSKKKEYLIGTSIIVQILDITENTYNYKAFDKDREMYGTMSIQ